MRSNGEPVLSSSGKYPGSFWQADYCSWFPSLSTTAISISTTKGRQSLEGQFEEPIEVQDPVPRNFATSFRQVNLDYPHADKRIFGKEWNDCEDMAAKKSWEAFQADPDWKAAKEASEKDGKLVDDVKSTYMKPTDSSPIK